MADQSIQYKNLSRLSNGTSSSFAMETSSFKNKRKDYRKQKKKAISDLFSTIEDINDIKSGWLKVRVSLKRWTKLWFILKPGFLLAFSSEDLSKKNQIGIISLKICQIIERPTKKEGFCFKLFSPIEKNIWLKNSALNLVLPQASLILRASDTDSGLDWMNAIRQSNISADLNSSQLSKSHYAPSETSGLASNNNNILSLEVMNGLEESSEGEYENTDQIEFTTSSLNSEDSRVQKSERNVNNSSIYSKFWQNSTNINLQSNYIMDGQEELGTVGKQTEVVAESNAKFLWHILKQVRPGMDLSKVTLPTFILEPRSFLEKLADYYYHNDILSEAVAIDDPLYRLINIVKWYLSGFYKKPMGLKKPYNPILGEKFRCFWEQPKTSSKTFYIAEQVSHHPPISAFHVTNRKDGFCLTSALLTKSKFFGNSVSAILDGKAKLYLMKRDETYTLTMPHAHCGGIILGSLCLELGGKVEISCPDTACRCELEFKLANMLSSADYYNSITGKIYQGNKITHTIDGHWDKKIYIVKKGATEERSILWEVTDDTRNSRLKRYIVSPQKQGEKESARLWSKVSEALKVGDHLAATKEKSFLEDAQRKVAKEQAENNVSWDPDLFRYDTFTNEWSYKYLDNRKWDELVDIYQYEKDFMVKTLSQTRSLKYDPNFDVLVNHIDRHKSKLSDHSSRRPDIDNSCSLMDIQEISPKSDNNVKSSVNPQSIFHDTKPNSKDESLRDIKLEVTNLKEQMQSLIAHQKVLKQEQSSPKSILNTRYLLLIVVLVLSMVVYQMFSPFYTQS